MGRGVGKEWNCQSRKRRRFICHCQIGLFPLPNSKDEICKLAPTPPPRIGPPITSVLQPPPAPALAAVSGDAARATPHSVHTHIHNYVCPPGHARWLHQMHVPVTKAGYSPESNHPEPLNAQFLKSADKLMSSDFHTSYISITKLTRTFNLKEQKTCSPFFFFLCPLR